MNENIKKLESLVHLAKTTSDEGRRELLRNVTDLFMDNSDGLNTVENQYFGDIMQSISYDLDMEIRCQLAAELACVETAPAKLIKKLAHDDIEIARPVLAQSPVLGDSDLVEVIENRGQGHMMAISIRPTLSETVTDSLVQHGNDEVLASVVSNEGADISQTSLGVVVDRAENCEPLHEPLISHRNLPPELAEQMFAFVSENLKKQLVANNPDINVDHLDELVDASKEKYGADTLKIIEAAEKLVDRKEKLNRLNPEFLLKMLREKKIPEFTSGFARLSKLDLRTARHTVFDEGGERLAILCKAIDITYEYFKEIIELTDFKKNRTDDDKATLLGVYGRITPELAQRALRFYRTRSNFNKPVPEPGASS